LLISASLKGASTNAYSAGSRQQTKRLLLCSTKVFDNRPGIIAGTFEIVLSQEAKDCGLWTLSTEKGTFSLTSDTPLDIVCTLPKPRSLGGIFVGSWKTYICEIIVKGGWCNSGDPEEVRIPISLKSYVSL
jgi:hypothetical protein